jgi:Kef-type K+ transport system membrane component KefB
VSPGDVVMLVVGGAFAVGGIVWLVRMAQRLRRQDEQASGALWLLVVERAVAWVVVGLALAFAAFGSPSVGHWLFLAAFVLLVVESLVWQMLLPRLARDFDKVMR